MSRLALTVLLSVAVGALCAPTAFAVDPHLDPRQVTDGCSACHLGHGVSRSPMLAEPQAELCLSCHDTRATLQQLQSNGKVGQAAAPTAMFSALQQPFTHPIDEEAFSRHEEGKVTCSSCHSPHRRSLRQEARAEGQGRRRLSPRDPKAFEFELCQRCHGMQGAMTEDLLDISRLTNPNNASYHPIEAPAVETSQSLDKGLSGAEINCSDCHGNNDPDGARGPHGSGVAFLLVDQYVTSDGADESRRSYALCYRCHDREKLFESSPFPLHQDHVEGLGASCATCHNAHGSVDNRALIRFGEETRIANVSPSASSGLLQFESLSAGSGSCYVTCHGVDHAPKSYGEITLEEMVPLISPMVLDAATPPPTVGGRSPDDKPRRKKRKPPR